MATNAFKDFLNALSSWTDTQPTNDYIYVYRAGVEKKMKLSVARQLPSIDEVSVTNVDLTNDVNSEVTITGTTEIESITVPEGSEVWVTFEDSLNLKFHSTDFPMVSDANILTQAGDRALVTGGPSDVGYIKQFIRKSGAPVQPGIVRVAAVSSANVTIATALNNGDSLNGVTLATDDLVLLPYQSTASANGLYVVGASPARDPRFTTYDSFQGVLFVCDAALTVDGPSIWGCTSDPGGTIGADDLDFEILVGRAGRMPTTAETVHLINANGLRIDSTSSTYNMLVRPGEAFTANRQLLINLNDAGRTLTIAGDSTISGTLTDTRDVVPKVDTDSPYTVLANETGTIFTNTGTAGDVTFVLPASAGCTAGKTRFSFYNLSAGAFKKHHQAGWHRSFISFHRWNRF